jgi:hypothetical protein
MTALPKFNTAPKYVVTAVNPETGAIAMETFIDGDYLTYGPDICNDDAKMNDFVRSYVLRNYAVVVTKTKLKMGKVDYQVVIAIHPDSVLCDCGKGILCPLNTQQVNYYKGQVVTRDLAAN